MSKDNGGVFHSLRFHGVMNVLLNGHFLFEFHVFLPVEIVFSEAYVQKILNELNDGKAFKCKNWITKHFYLFSFYPEFSHIFFDNICQAHKINNSGQWFWDTIKGRLYFFVVIQSTHLSSKQNILLLHPSFYVYSTPNYRLVLSKSFIITLYPNYSYITINN